MPSVQPPNKTQILVVGGGPSGSYAAAALALEGFDVVLLEMAKFPRYHIGESLLPSVRHYLRFIGAEDAVAAFGFARKPGAAVKFNQHMREGYTDFVALGAQNSSWNVVRAQFDQLLLQHAAACGVRVFDQTRVTEVRFAPSARNGKPNGARTADGGGGEHGDRDAAPELGRPTAVAYETVRGGTGEIAFDYLVDASGRQGVMSTRYMMNRKFNAALRNVAVWGYWRGTGMYGRGTSRENAPWFEALSDESGWAWFIPLHDGLASVGVVMDQQLLAARTRTGDIPPAPPSLRTPATLPASPLAARYVGLLALAPGLLALLGAGELVGAHGEDGKAPPLARSTSDFSYAADAYAGEGFRVVGDAGAFIDPFFSSGIHLAMTGALAAAASISASIRGDCSELAAARWHTGRVAVSYTRFQVVVMSAYKQIRAQSVNVLADLDENSFDRAFAFFRPVIQGGADVGTRLSEDEIQRALDFCAHVFDPTSPEQHESVRRKLQSISESTPKDDDDGMHDASDAERRPNGDTEKNGRQDAPSEPMSLLDVRAPVVDPARLETLLRNRLALHSTAEPSPETRLADLHADPEVKMVLDKVNARRIIHAEHGSGVNSLEEEAVEGFVVRMQRGNLGLCRRI